jgi:hypothetical protein
MAKRLSRVAMVRETGNVGAEDKTNSLVQGHEARGEINCGKC